MSELSRYHTGINSCISVSGALYRRLQAESQARGRSWSMAKIVELVIVKKSTCSICGARPTERCKQESHILAYRARMAESNQ